MSRTRRAGPPGPARRSSVRDALQRTNMRWLGANKPFFFASSDCRTEASTYVTHHLTESAEPQGVNHVPVAVIVTWPENGSMGSCDGSPCLAAHDTTTDAENNRAARRSVFIN